MSAPLCDNGRMSIYIGYTVAQLDPLIASAMETRRAFLAGEMVQRIATGDTSVAFANGNLSLAAIDKDIAALRAARAAALAAPDGLVPASTPLRPVFPWV